MENIPRRAFLIIQSMKISRQIAFFAVLLCMPFAISAQESPPAASTSATASTPETVSTPETAKPGFFEAATERVGKTLAPLYRAPVMTGLHTGFAWASVVTGLASAIMTPALVGRGVDDAFSYSAAGMSLATMLLGEITYYGDTGPQHGLSSNNIHALLGALGGALTVVTPLFVPMDARPWTNGVGAALMGASIVVNLAY